MNNTVVTRIGAYGVIVDGGQMLLCRLSEEVSTHKGMWTLPGGGLEFGEHPETAMVRELKEETGFKVVPTGLVGIHSFTRESFHGLQIVYTAKITGGELSYEQQGTTDMCAWHPITDIPELDAVELVHTAIAMLPDFEG